jgi:hypothetical protein
MLLMCPVVHSVSGADENTFANVRQLFRYVKIPGWMEYDLHRLIEAAPECKVGYQSCRD